MDVLVFKSNFVLTDKMKGSSYYWQIVKDEEGEYDLSESIDPPQSNVNYFTLSDGVLSYTPATTGEDIISLGEENKFALYINMNGYPKFSIADDLKANVHSCYIYVGDEAILTGLGDDYTIRAANLADGKSFTVDNTKFVKAGNGSFDLTMVGGKAIIEAGSVYLSNDNGEYSGRWDGSVVTYEYAGELQGETAIAEFSSAGESPGLASITGLDKAGETVTVAKGGVTTTYEKTAFGLKRTQDDKIDFYTGTATADTNVLGLTGENDWSDVQPLTFSLTLGKPYYEVTAAAGALTGYDTPPESGNYFEVDDNGTINYVSKDIALNGKVKVTMEVDASDFTGKTLDLYRGEGEATFNYNVTNLKKATTVTKVAKGDYFATAESGEFSFTRAGENEPVTFNVTTDQAVFWVNDSTVDIRSGSVVLSMDNGQQRTYSGTDGESVIYGYTGEGEANGAAATFANGGPTSITGLDKEGETVTVILPDDTGVTYEKAAYGIKRTKDGVNTFYTGTDADTANVLDITDWIPSTELKDPTFELTLDKTSGETYYEVKEAGKLTGSSEIPPSGNYFKVDNDTGAISYVSSTEGLPVKLSGNVTMEVNASVVPNDRGLTLYRGEANGATFSYKVTKLNALVVSNVDTGDTFETARKGSFSFKLTEERGQHVLPFDVTSETATFCVDDSTVAIKDGTVNLSSDEKLYASGSKAHDFSDNATVELTSNGGSGEVEVGVTEGDVTSIKGLDNGETVTCGKTTGNTTYKAVGSNTVIRTIITTVGGEETKTIDKLTTTGATGNVDLLADGNEWVSNKSTMGEVSLNLTLTGSNQYWILSGDNKVTPVESQPDGYKNCFKLVGGELSYEPARLDDADEIISLGENSNVKLTVKMAENANTFSVTGDLKAKVTSCDITGVDGATVTGFANGYTFKAEGLAVDNSVTINEQKFTMAASDTFELSGVNNTTDNKVQIANGAIKLGVAGDSSTKEYYSTEGARVMYGAEDGSNGAAVAFNNGEVSSITGIDQVGEMVSVKKGEVTTIYGLDDTGIYKKIGTSTEYYTKETAEGELGKVDVIDTETTDWTACKEVTLTKPIITITPESDATSYYIVTAGGNADGLEVTASKQTDKPTRAQNYFTVTNKDEIYSLTYTKSALNPINLSGAVTVNLNGSNISGGTLELYKPVGEGATFTYNVTNLNVPTVTNVAQGDTFETAMKGTFVFTTAGEQSVKFGVTTDQAAFCVDNSTVAIKSGTVQLSSGDAVFASGSKADDSSDNVEVELTGEGEVAESVKVEVTNGKVTSITGLDNSEVVTCYENTTNFTTFKVVGSTIIKTVRGDGVKEITKLNTEGDTGKINLVSSDNAWVSNQTTMGDVSFEFKLTGGEQYWILSGNTLKQTNKQPGEYNNFFKLSSTGKLTYTPAKNDEADIITLSADSKVTLKVDMSAGGAAPKFSVNGDLANYITACNITGVNGATVTGFADGYTFTATDLEVDDFVTINDQKFTMAAGDGALKLSGVITTNGSGSKARIENGAIKLGVEEEYSTNEYYSTGGSTVKYGEEQDSEVELNGATVAFKDGAVSSITGIDVAGEIVKVKNSDGETTYGLNEIGIYRYENNESDKKAYYTGTVADGAYGEVNVIDTSAKDWIDYKEVTLTDPTIAITPEFDGTSYYIVTATGSRATVAKLKDGVPTGAQNYFTVAKEGETYKLTYTESAINPIHLKDSVTVTLNGSNITSDSTFELYHPEEGATFTYNVTALKSGAAFTNVSSGDTFAATAKGSYSFTMAGGEEAQEAQEAQSYSYSVTAASNFVADESAVAMYSGTATLDADYKELVASGKDKTATSDNVKVEFKAAEGNDGSKATVKVVNGVVTSITGLQKDDSVKITANDKTATYTKTSTGFTRTIGDESAAYTGTITDIITAISKEKEWYALGNVEFKDGVVLDLGTVTADSYYTLTKITEKGATVVKATETPNAKENYFTVSKEGLVSYHQAESSENDTLKATANASQATVKFAAQNLTTLTLSGQGKEANGVKNYEVSGVKKDATVNGVANGDIIKTAGTATVNDFLYESTAGALEIRGIAVTLDSGDVPTPGDPEEPVEPEDVEDTTNSTALYSGTVNVFEKDLEEEEDYTKTLTVVNKEGATETVTITSSSNVTTKTGAVVTAKDGEITVIKDLEEGETITHIHGNVTDTYIYNGTSIIKTTVTQDVNKTYAYDVAAAKNTNVLTIKENQWENVTGGITAGEKIVLNITLPATATEDGVFYEVTGSKSTNIKVAANPSKDEPFGSNYFEFFESAEGIYSLEYNPAEDNTEGSFSIKLGNAQANINATAIEGGKTLNLTEGVEGYLPTYNVTGLKAGVNITSDDVGFTVTTAALKKDNEIKIDDVTYTAGANGALKFEKDKDNVVIFQTGTLNVTESGGTDDEGNPNGVKAKYAYTDPVTRQKETITATIKSTVEDGKDGVLLTATAAGGLTVKDLEEGETVTIQVGDGDEYTYQLDGDKLTRTDGSVTSIYTGAAKFAATADVFAAATNTSKWVKIYTVEPCTDTLTLNPTGVNTDTGKSVATYYRVELEDDGKVNVTGISTEPEYTVPTDANYFAVTATGAVTYHTNEYQKADLSNATVKVDYTKYSYPGAKFTTVARPKNVDKGAAMDNNVGSYEYVANAGMTFTGLTKADSVTANLNNNEKVTVNGTAFTAGADSQSLEVGITTNELKKEVAALKSASTILVKGTYYVEIDEEGPYAKVVSTGNGVNVTFDENNDITSISGFDKNEKIEVYEPDDLNTKVEKITTYQVNAAGTMVIWTDSENHQQQAALVDGAITLSGGTTWEDLAFAGSATLTLNDKTEDGTYGVDKKFLNSATAAATFIKEGEEKTTVGGVIIGNGNNSFTAADNFKGNVKITTSGKSDWELTGSNGNDTFTLGTATTLHGSKGNDTITSSAKADTFDYTTAEDLTGEDMIKSFTSTAKVVDTIKVGGDAGFTLEGAGTNVKLTIGDENGKKVSLVGMVGKEIDVAKGNNAATAYIVGNETKANTFTLTNAQLENDENKSYSLIGGSAANDTFKVANNGTSTLNLNLETMAKRVEIFTATGSKSAVNVTNAGTFVSLTGGNAGDTITAGEYTKWISGGKGNDSIDFGVDHENGIIYQLNAGDGEDTIANFDKTKDKIYLGKGSITTVTSSDSGVIIEAGKDSVLLKDVTDIKDIKNNLYTSAGKQISDAWYYNSDDRLPDGVTFAGNTITLGRNYKGYRFDLSGTDDFDGWVAANKSTYNSLNITATAVQSALLIKGSDENNIIKAGGKVGAGVTSIVGGEGNDTLYGGAGTDAFIFEENHGQDTVNNFISGKDVVILSSAGTMPHTTTGANLTINTDGDNSITLIGKANTRIDILGEDDAVAPASDYSTAYYFGKTSGTNTYSVNAHDMLNAHFFGTDGAKDTLTITAKGASLSEGSALKETADDGKSYIKVDLSKTDKFRFIDELNAQAVSQNLHIKSGYTVADEEAADTKTTTIKAGKGSDSIECADCKDVIYYGGYGFGNDTISGFNAETDKLWVANTIKSVTALDNRVEIIFGSGKNESTLTVMGEGLTAQDLDENQAVIASATAKANAASWTTAYDAYKATLK